jgi:carbon storage regulator CsrA
MEQISRKENERIVIRTPQGDVVITVVLICNRNRVRVGVDAPKEVKILRSEKLEYTP